MKIIISACMAAGLACSLHGGENDAPPSKALTLEAVTRAVLENNPSIKEAKAKWEAALQRAPQANAWEDLKVSAGSRVGRFVSIAPNSFGDQMASIEQMIPIAGKNKSRARAAAIEAIISAEEIRRRQFDAVAKARTAFFRLCSLHALLGLNSADEASLKQFSEITRTKFESGSQSESDVLMAENETNKIHEARQDLLQEISEMETEISVMMNRDPFQPLGTPVERSPGPASLPTERIKDLTFSNRPEIRAADAAVSLARVKLELAKRDRIPEPALSITGQRYNAASQVVSEVAVGVTINIPWLNGKKYRAEEAEAASGIDAAEHAAQAARMEALGLLKVQLQKLETAAHHIALYNSELIPKAKRTVEALQTGYQTDKKSFLDLITAQRNLRDLEIMLQKHMSDQATAMAGLEAIVGTDLRPFSKPSSPKKGAHP